MHLIFLYNDNCYYLGKEDDGCLSFILSYLSNEYGSTVQKNTVDTIEDNLFVYKLSLNE